MPVFDNMMAQGVLGAAPAMFAFWLNRTSGTGVGVGGELTLGGVDPAHYSGSINWVSELPALPRAVLLSSLFFSSSLLPSCSC